MMETIYDALRQSHETQRSLCRRLVRAGNADRRREVLQKQLAIELEAHASAEERFLYVPMLMEDSGLSSSRHALSEHHEIEEMVEELKALAPDGDAWLDKARKLSKAVHHHLKEEERGFFQLSGKILSEKQKTVLARQYREDYERLRRKLAG